MRGIDKITARIEADAAAAAEETLRQAKSRCEELNAEAEQRAQERYWQQAQAGMKSVEERSQRLRSAAEMEAKKTLLVFKQETVAAIFDEVEARILALPEEKYLELLETLALRAVQSGREELVLNGRDRARLGEKLLGRLNKALAAEGRCAELALSTEDGDFKGGLLLRQGNVGVNATVDVLVENAREELASEVARVLFS